MTMLRENIEKIIAETKNPQQSAISVCIYLESILDLNGNGWFDDDDIMLALLNGDSDLDDNG